VLYATWQWFGLSFVRTMGRVPGEGETMEASTARRIASGELAKAASVLARAFYDDPVCKYFWPDDRKRAARSEACFQAQLRALEARREVHVDDSFSSVAVWARPDEWKVSATTALRLLPRFLRNGVRLSGMLANLKTEHLHPDEPHWYLEFLGTEPSRQGSGLGGRALAPVLARADAEGLPVWAFSSNRQNLGFYHRHGFVVLDEVPFAKDGPMIFPIRRAPVG
jgi:GNAT superfamily N-acetyltransferase